ncbi:MAG: hypothetical protein AAF664_01435 [Planctomycetota bacterium]
MFRLKTHFRHFVITCIILVGFTSSLSAAVISIPDMFVVEGTDTVEFIVTIDGTEQIVGVTSAIVQVGDGGPALGGSSTTPQITSTDFSQSIFFNGATAPGGVDPIIGGSLPTPSAIIDPGINLNQPATDFVIANGELFRFTLNTSGLTAGQSFTLTMDTLGTLGQTTELQLLGGTTQTPMFAPTGSLTVTAIPEPLSGMLMMAVAATAACSRRTRSF